MPLHPTLIQQNNAIRCADTSHLKGLQESLAVAKDFVSFLEPDWLQAVSESCALEDL